jgi:NAD-dependent dihydropyrimidine dehydrogenase PreA subunit
MNVDMIDDSRKRCNGTECILCAKCINECPMKALKLTFFEREKKRD